MAQSKKTVDPKLTKEEAEYKDILISMGAPDVEFSEADGRYEVRVSMNEGTHACTGGGATRLEALKNTVLALRADNATRGIRHQ